MPVLMAQDAATSTVSVQEAADLLNVSKAYMLGLVEKGAIPLDKSGRERGLLRKNVLEYRRALRAEQLRGLEELTALSESMGLYDEPAK